MQDRTRPAAQQGPEPGTQPGSEPKRNPQDRRESPRLPLDNGELEIEIRSGEKCIRGDIRNISRGGLKVELPGTMHHYFLSQRRLIHVEIRSQGQPVLVAYMVVVYVEAAADQSRMILGLQHIDNDRFVRVESIAERDPANFLDRRGHPRSVCEVPGILITSGGETEQSLPVFVSNISEGGCRIEGPENLDYLLPGAVIQICIQPWEMDPIRMLAEVVKRHTQRAVGVRFRSEVGSPERQAIEQLVVSMRYPELVVGDSEHADQIWETISASGYFRERSPETYLRLHDHAVQCWHRLNSAAGRVINRTLITPDEDGQIQSVSQLSRIYPQTWMAHHLAVLGERDVRTRLAPQQFCGGFDVLQQIGARFFINFHNTVHKAQSRIWQGLQEHCPRSDFSLQEVLCYDIATSDPTPTDPSRQGIRIREAGADASPELYPRLHDSHSPLVFSAMGLDEDLELERLGLDYQQAGLQRRRCWLLAHSISSGALLGFASLEIVPTGFNLTSIGDHVRLYLWEDDATAGHTAVVARRLTQHACAHFRRLEKPFFVLMAATRWERLLARALRLTPMAKANELVMRDRVFPTVRDFISRMYVQREDGK